MATAENLSASKGLYGVTAAILAGGLGTRLRPAVADRPKVLAEIRGRPFLACLLDQLVAAGIRRVVLCTGYLGGQVQEMFGDSYANLRLVYSQEPLPLGTAGALRLALPFFESDSVLVMNGDSFCGIKLDTFWDWHRAREANATLALAHMEETKGYGQVHVDGEGVVTKFTEKVAIEGPAWINAGIYLLNRSLLLTIAEGHIVSLELEVFPAWVGKGLYGYRSEGCFLDIGTPETYQAANQFFAAKAII